MTIEITKGCDNPVSEFFSSYSQTPETDECGSHEGNWDTKFFRMQFHARNLERQRDEARQCLKEIEEYGTEEINAAIDLRRNLAQALVDLDDMQGQRDEAREQNAKLREIAEMAIEYVGHTAVQEKLRAELEQCEIK
jgi:hypothetical protein